MAMIWEAHAPSIRWNINIISVAFVLFVITTCSLALITKSCFFAVGAPVEAHHKRKMRWNQEKPHKNEHQTVSKYICFPHFFAQKMSVGGTLRAAVKPTSLWVIYEHDINILNQSIFYEMLTSWVCRWVQMMSSKACKVIMFFNFLAQMIPNQSKSKKMQKLKYIPPPFPCSMSEITAVDTYKKPMPSLGHQKQWEL